MIFVYGDRWYSGPTGSGSRRQVGPRSEEIREYPEEGLEIAALLDTSAEYLVTGSDPEILSGEERKLIQDYRKLDRADQENIALAIDA
jgi:hypothetical protein